MNTKQASAVERLLAVGVPDPQAPQVPVLALGGDRRAAGAHLDVRQRRDLLDQVVRHRLLERRPRTSIVTLAA